MSEAIGLPDAKMLCDTPDCGYFQMVKPRSVRAYVGAECPRCGSVMVTEDTAEKVEEGLALIDALNAAIGPVERSTDGGGMMVSTRVDRHGDVAEVSFKRVKQ